MLFIKGHLDGIQKGFWGYKMRYNLEPHMSSLRHHCPAPYTQHRVQVIRLSVISKELDASLPRWLKINFYERSFYRPSLHSKFKLATMCVQLPGCRSHISVCPERKFSEIYPREAGFTVWKMIKMQVEFSNYIM